MTGACCSTAGQSRTPLCQETQVPDKPLQVQEARVRLRLVRIGMTQEEVKALAGEPDRKEEKGWIYNLPLDEDLSFHWIEFENGVVKKSEKRKKGCAIIL